MQHVIALVFLIGPFIVGIQAQDPEIVKDILPEIQRVGRTGKLNCTVARLGDNSVQWAFKGEPEYIVSINQVIQTLNTRQGGIPQYHVERTVEGGHVTFTLVIARLKPQFSGIYECTIAVKNKPDDTWARKTGELIVQYPPLIRPGSTTTVRMIEKGENATIECDADSVPRPNITWSRSDGRILPNGKALSRGKTLHIRYADVEYAGVYRCVADNSIKPPAHALTQVYVFQVPTARALQDSVGQFANGRQLVRLDCIVQGFPIPTVYWEKHGKSSVTRLKNDDKHTTTKQATDNQNLLNGEQWYTLEIRNVQPGDIARYSCVGENSKGSGRADVVLFETQDCQGPLCFSIEAESDQVGGRAGKTNHLCPLTVILCLWLSVLLRLASNMASR